MDLNEFLGLMGLELWKTCSNFLKLARTCFLCASLIMIFQQPLQIQNFKSLQLAVTKLLNFTEIHREKGVAAFLIIFLISPQVLPFICSFSQNFKPVQLLVPDMLINNHFLLAHGNVCGARNSV